MGMTLLMYHIIVVGIMIAVTAYIAYNAGKNSVKGKVLTDLENENKLKYRGVLCTRYLT